MNKLEGFPTVYCASLEESTDRREKLNAQFAEYGLTPNYLLSKRYHECDDIALGFSLWTVENMVKGCAISHLKMIKKWYDTTDEEYGFFCEDDLSLETVKNWNFTFQDFINQLPSDWEAVQMCVIRDMFGEIELRERQLDDWAVTAYIIKRDYAKKIIDHCIIQLKDIIENLPPYWGKATAYRLEVNNWIQLQPLVEHLIFLNRGKVYAYPLLVEDISGPTTSNTPQLDNHTYSSNYVRVWWELRTHNFFKHIQ